MSTPPEPDDIAEDIDDISLDDIPPGADMAIVPQGNPQTQVGSRVYVVWKGRKTGLFYSWYVLRFSK